MIPKEIIDKLKLSDKFPNRELNASVMKYAHNKYEVVISDHDKYGEPLKENQLMIYVSEGKYYGYSTIHIEAIKEDGVFNHYLNLAIKKLENKIFKHESVTRCSP